MTLRHLHIFVSVCEYGGMTKAAEALHITQPAISHTISELEKYYQVTLFDRINQRLVLTEIGKEILEKARKILKEFEEFEALVMLGSKHPRVRIGATPTLGQTVIPTFLQQNRISAEHIKLKISIKSSLEIEHELENGTLDFALMEEPIISPYLEAAPFQKDRFLLAANQNFDIPDLIIAENVLQYPLMLRETGSSSRKCFDRVFSKYGYPIEPMLESADDQAILSALYASAGIAFLSEHLISNDIASRKLKEIQVEHFDGSYMNYLVIHKNKSLSLAAQEAYTFFQKYYNKI